MYHNQCFEQKQEKEQDFSDEIFIFTTENNLCILHGQVFAMIVSIPRPRWLFVEVKI